LDTPNKQSGKSHRNEVAAYVNFHQEVAKWLTLDAGLRFDHHSITGTELIPQGGLVFHTPKNGDLKMSVSKGFRNPTMREMYLYPPSNTELEPESIVTYEMAWNQRLLDNRLSYGVNVFYLTGDNMIQQQMVEGRPRNVNTGEVENCGAELNLDYRINGQWGVTTNHSYLHMENPVLAAPTYKGYAGVRYHQGRWSSQAGVQYVSGLYTEVGADEDKENFCLFSASVSHRVWRGLTLWLRGETLIGKREYEVIKGYPLPHATFMGGFSWNF
jgi:iron complex outermembrane receptor protein